MLWAKGEPLLGRLVNISQKSAGSKGDSSATKYMGWQYFNDFSSVLLILVVSLCYDVSAQGKMAERSCRDIPVLHQFVVAFA